MSRKQRRTVPTRSGGSGPPPIGPVAMQLFARGIQEHQAGQLEAAAASYRAAINLAPRVPEIHNNLGLALSGLGRHDEAVAVYRQAIAVKPDYHDAFFNLGLALATSGRANDAATAYRRALALKPDFAETHYNLGNALRAQGRLDAAISCYRRAIALKPDYPDAFNNLGAAFKDSGDANEAAAAFRQAAALNPNAPEAYNNLGLVLSSVGQLDEAAASFRRAAALRPDYADAHANLGVVLYRLGKPQEAVAAYRDAITARPTDAEAYNRLGAVLRALGHANEAAASFERAQALNALAEAADRFERALALKPDDAEAQVKLGLVRKDQGRLADAAACFERAAELRPDLPDAHFNLAIVRKEQGRLAEAVACYERTAELRPDLANAHYNLGMQLQYQGRTEEASERLRRVLAIDPDHGEARLGLCMSHLPVIASTDAEIAGRRDAYATALAGLCAAADAPEARRRLGEAVGVAQPFYLAYQGRNDRDLQSRYGALVCSLMAERFPPAPLAPPPLPGEPIRVGIVSGFFRNHSNWKIPIKGWLGQLDRSRFEFYGYYLGQHRDDATRMAESLCRRFVRGPLPLASWRETILADRPHLLIYPEIGMDPVAPALAALRLAPVQCNSWGHPETSGFPTLDYFLSSALMEPPDGDAYYSERLVRLPNLSIHYEPVEVEPARVERAQLGLRPGATVYWCCQSLYKYLPQFDDVFPRIAQAAEDCQFVFLETPLGARVTNIFRERLERAFAGFGLDAKRYCVVLPALTPARFHGAMACCDVFLDSIGWSGCNSTLESLNRDLPIVTMRSGPMRGRHSAAILAMMDMTETVTERIEDYVALAVRMARDPAWRAELRRKTAANKHRIWRDHACIAALEDFLEQAVRRPAPDVGAGVSA